MKLTEIMTEQVEAIDTEASASAAWTRMRQKHIRHLVVTENDKIVGVISERDLGGKNGSEIRRGRKVYDLMTHKIATATPDMSLREAANLMRGRLIGCLPVLEGDRLIGIVTATDVLDAMGRGLSRPEGLYRRPAVVRPPASQKKTARRQVTRPAGRRERGRKRSRVPDSEDRAPFADEIPRPIKAVSGRTKTSLIPAHIHDGFPKDDKLDEVDKVYIRRKLGMKLGKFAHSIERATVRLKDINGPRGGIDKICRIKVVLSGFPSLVIEEQALSFNEAFDKALSRTENAVRRQLQRRQSRKRTNAFTLSDQDKSEWS